MLAFTAIWFTGHARIEGTCRDRGGFLVARMLGGVIGRRDVGWPRDLGILGQLGRVCVVNAKGLSSANTGVEERRQARMVVGLEDGWVG